MKSIIEELWNGNVSPCERPYGFSEEYRCKLSATREKLDALLELLDDEGRARFDEFEDAMNDMSFCSVSEAFHKGFALGVRFTAEAYQQDLY